MFLIPTLKLAGHDIILHLFVRIILNVNTATAVLEIIDITDKEGFTPLHQDISG